MEDIIAPIDRELLKSELTAERRLRSTNKSHNEIYIVNWKNAPNVLKEIGRLREIAFRAAGGGKLIGYVRLFAIRSQRKVGNQSVLLLLTLFIHPAESIKTNASR